MHGNNCRCRKGSGRIYRHGFADSSRQPYGSAGDTGKKVMNAIRRLDYYPNRPARQFRTQVTGIILVIAPELANTFYHEIISGIESVASGNGYHIVISQIHNDEALEDFFRLSAPEADGRRYHLFRETGTGKAGGHVQTVPDCSGLPILRGRAVSQCDNRQRKGFP